MSSLKGKISENLKQAMKSKDVETTSVLRMLIAAIRNKEISLRPAFTKASADASSSVKTTVDKKALADRSTGEQDGKAELNDGQIVEVIAKEIKKRRDSVEAYLKGKRPELADKESAEIKILEKYLPEQLGEAELEKIIKEAVASGAADFGKAMGQVMAKVKGRTDGNKVGELVKKILAK